jgi:putative two-component system response regulator
MSEKSVLLIVDDEPIAQMTLKALLGGGQYHLEFASNGKEGIEKALVLNPDLVLLDVMLPGMDGFEVCRKIRSVSQLAEVPVMLVTSLEDRESRLRGFEAGAEYFVSKPFDALELQTRVRTVTQLNRYRRLQEQLEKAIDLTLESFVRALGQRHKESEAHTRHLMVVTQKLAERMNFPASSMGHLRRGVQMHDLGKIGIPDSIHLKRGPLTPSQLKKMRTHPQMVFDMFKDIDFLQPALEIAYCHHEKWDGSGYPRGLVGEEIPYSARMFAIVDVWEALSTDRHYRPSDRRRWPAEDVHAYLKDQSGKHFDPQFVEPFLSLLFEEHL